MPQVIHHNIARTDSVPTDTAKTDSSHVEASFVPAYVNGFPDSTMMNREYATIDNAPMMVIPQGEKPVPYESTPLHDASIMGLVLLSFFFIAITYRTGHKYISDFTHNMFSVRKRNNVFDDHTVSETQIMTALIGNTCLLEAIALYLGIQYLFPDINISSHVTLAVLGLAGITLIYYLAQFVLFHLLGFVFSNKVDTKLWIDGFKATQSILGLCLFPITFIMLLYPVTVEVMLIIALALYFIARCIFISKGFRIFFNNFSSSVYFILYLCTVEIIPVIVTFVGAVSLCKIIG